MEKILYPDDNLSIFELYWGKREGENQKGAFPYCWSPFFRENKYVHAAAVLNTKSIADAKKKPTPLSLSKRCINIRINQAVIPAKRESRQKSGFRVKPGMTDVEASKSDLQMQLHNCTETQS